MVIIFKFIFVAFAFSIFHSTIGIFNNISISIKMKKNNYGDRPRGSHEHTRQNSSLDVHNLLTREITNNESGRSEDVTEKSEDNNSNFESEYSQRPISHLTGLLWCII